MGVDLLDTPLRVTWEIPADSAMSTERLLEIAERVGEAGVFFVTLQGRSLVHPADGQLLSRLQENGARTLVMCHGSAEELAALHNFADQVDQLLLDLNSLVDAEAGFDDGRLQVIVEETRQAGIEPVLSLVPLRWNLLLIPEILRFCSTHDIIKFKLPNASIGDSFREYSDDDLPRAADLQKFQDLWTHADKPEMMPALEVHDLFLWEIMTPGVEQSRSEYGGCQAANSLAHIDASGTVHPCAAWPEPLGSLLAASFLEIWQAAPRLLVRDEIARTPAGCAGCCDWSLCLGGCRGLSRMLNRTHGCRDLMCSDRRG